jgi:predicted TIM-barrel fold metal-dependent hydrolase
VELMKNRAKLGTLSRRRALAIGAGAAGAVWLGRGVFGSGEAFADQSASMTAAPATGLLRKRIKGRTINVHTHVLGEPSGGPIPEPSVAPFAPAAEITEAERAEARTFLTRFKHDMHTFDTPEQQEEVLRRHAHNETRGRTGSFEQNAAHFIGEMDEAGIDTSVVLFLDFAAPMLRKGPVDPSTERAEEALVAAARVAAHFPGRFINFAGIDVRRGAAGVPLLEKAVKEYGFRGCGEIVTTLWQTPPDDREHCYPYYEACLGLGIPVMIDCTMDRGFTIPDQYEQVAKDFPKLQIGLGGAGIRVAPVERNGKMMPAWQRMLELAEQYDNLWLDLDDWQVVDAKGIERYLRHLRRALDGPARERIMFGSDYPVFAWMYTEAGWIRFVLDHMASSDISFTDEDLELFFSRNALGYLGLKT